MQKLLKERILTLQLLVFVVVLLGTVTSAGALSPKTTTNTSLISTTSMLPPLAAVVSSEGSNLTSLHLPARALLVELGGFFYFCRSHRQVAVIL